MNNIARVATFMLVMLASAIAPNTASAADNETSPTDTPSDTTPMHEPTTLTGVPPEETASETPVTIKVASSPPLPSGTPIVAKWETPWNSGVSEQVAFTDEMGSAMFVISAWKDITVTVTAPDGSSTVIPAPVVPAVKPVKDPNGAPQQAKKYKENTDPAAKGKGPNPTITPVGQTQRRAMMGVSWRPGCIPISDLREVHVNYWGLDGYRHRGVLIVNESIAKPAARLFSDLYQQKYRIQTMHPVDRYGRNPKGPGANDYASMKAGNTSAFNCRYVVGQKSARVRSPHASGRALDVNTWHNPYVSRTGVYPNSWWLRKTVGPVPFLDRPKIRKIFNRHGWVWLGGRGDYHHWDYHG